MIFNWHPQSVAFLDFETRSECELVSRKRYAEHPSTVALTCCVKVDGVMTRIGPMGNFTQLAAITEGRTIVAHNASFDEAIWTKVLGLPEREWLDTMPCARAGGYPGGLDKLSAILGGRGKDKNGKRLIDMLCIGKQRVPYTSPSYDLLLDYNEQDVEELEFIYGKVKEYVEPDVMDVDWAINNRGMPLDKEYLERLVVAFEQNSAESMDNFQRITGGCNPNSPSQVVDWLRKQGFQLEGINKYALKNFKEKPEDFFIGDSDMDAAAGLVFEALQQRREVVRVGKGKADSAVAAIDDDGRLRDQLVYYGAHTGRWSGRKLQPHNLPTALHVQGMDTVDLQPDYGVVREYAESSSKRLNRIVHVSDILNTMIRHALRAPNLCVADYGQVETRGTAYLAGDDRMLAILTDPKRSIYLDMAKSLYGYDVKKDENEKYNFCKAIVLGCTYGMSGKRFEWQYKMRHGNIEPGCDINTAVRTFRETYPKIPQLWKDFTKALHYTVEHHQDTYAGKCILKMAGDDLLLELPSGRCLIYRKAHVEMCVPAYCALYNMPKIEVPTVVYTNHHGGRGFLYGSKLTENVVQAMCRDFLADSLVRSEKAGFNPCLHVHDEQVCETDRLNDLLELMSTPPEWAPDFPLLIEGYTGPVWTKQAKGRFKERVAMKGRML